MQNAYYDGNVYKKFKNIVCFRAKLENAVLVQRQTHF